jgi:hypothetical protein
MRIWIIWIDRRGFQKRLQRLFKLPRRAAALSLVDERSRGPQSPAVTFERELHTRIGRGFQRHVFDFVSLTVQPHNYAIQGVATADECSLAFPLLSYNVLPMLLKNLDDLFGVA